MARSNHNTRETHGDTETRLYNIWSSMKQRTMNPNTINYASYGGKGVSVCEEWQKYEPFKKWSLELALTTPVQINKRTRGIGHAITH